MPQKILVVDDEPDLVVAYERLLRRLGYLCLSASTAADALAVIDRERPDLVVTDLRLPGADGFAVIRHAHRQTPPIPAILITAYDSQHARGAAIDSGATAYLAKPFHNSVFIEAVQQALARDSTRGAHPS